MVYLQHVLNRKTGQTADGRTVPKKLNPKRRRPISVDALLGLTPLEEAYKPSDSGTVEYWEHRPEYLLRTRKSMWNQDYMRFLIRDVWSIREPVTVLDCGCGYRALGLMMMPLLPSGSRYVGIDFSRNMIQAAEQYYRPSCGMWMTGRLFCGKWWASWRKAASW